MATTEHPLDATDVRRLCSELHDDPLFNFTLASQELWHSNLIAWLAEHYPTAIRHALEPWLERLASGKAARPEREWKKLDLLLRFAGAAPLVIENKMFSVPSPAQLTDYSIKIDADREMAGATRALLSPLPPTQEVSGWKHISYPALAAGLRSELEEFQDAYVWQTVSRYTLMVERLNPILEWAAHISEPGACWQLADPGGALSLVRIRPGCVKLRADAVAAALRARIAAEGLAGKVYVHSAYTNGEPLVEMFQDRKDRVGFQLQGNQWRLATQIWSLAGKTSELRQRRTETADRMSWFEDNFGALADVVPDARPGGRPGWKRFDDAFVYRYYRVDRITVGQLLEAGIRYARLAADHEEAVFADLAASAG
jgi:hypothetical protein